MTIIERSMFFPPLRRIQVRKYKTGSSREQPFLGKTNCLQLVFTSTKDYNNMSMGMKVIAGILKLSKGDNTKQKKRRITLRFLHIEKQL